MATFNVFVEGPVETMGLPALAEAMSQRYGLPAAELVSRLQRGRFRVKSNLDLATAERYRRDLERIGARVIVENADVSPTDTPVAGVPVQGRAPALSLPPLVAQQAAETAPTQDPRTFTILGPQHTRDPGRPGSVSTPPARAPSQPSAAPQNRASSQPSSGLAAAGTARPSVPQLASGLAAAFTPALERADLGALAQSSFSLSSLDGHDDVAPEPAPAIINIQAKPNAPRAKPSPSKPMDLFAPPDAGDQELKVELATEEIAERAAKRASIPPPQQPAPPSPRMGTQPTTSGTTAAPRPFSREQFLLGIVIALFVGFLPAHFVASAREKAAFMAIDRNLVAVQDAADTPDSYQMLDAARVKFRDEKEAKRSSIALQSMLIWALVSAGVGYAFFKLRARAG